jgi:2-polyprenyl-3-methyl-5-hydroxy-6-metoxy-1,4-benzoquinol methylase
MDARYAYADFAAEPDPSHRPMYLADVLAALAELPAGAAVLDAGCGGGDFSVGLRRRGFAVYGSDLSPSAIAAAQERGVGRFAVASLYDPLAAPFGLAAFDAIVSIEVIEHLYSPATFARRAHEALRPGGLLVVSTPYWGYAKNVVLALANRIDRALTPLWEGGHIKHFSRATLTRLMTEAGFVTVSFRGCGGGWRRHAPGLWNGMLMTFRKPA